MSEVPLDELSVWVAMTIGWERQTLKRQPFMEPEFMDTWRHPVDHPTWTTRLPDFLRIENAIKLMVRDEWPSWRHLMCAPGGAGWAVWDADAMGAESDYCPTPAEAICRAFLKLKEVEPDE